MANHHGDGPTTLKAICAARDLPKQYLVKLFSSLAKADIVTAIRGKRGGYVLSREPKQITVLEVIEAVEGPIALNYCQHTPPKCEEDHCKLRPVWTELQGIFRGKLSAVTIGDCVKSRGRAKKGN